MRRVSVTGELTPIKAEEFTTTDLHRHTPHSCLPVFGPLTVNRLILFNGSGLFFTGPWLQRQHKALRLCPALWSSFAVQSAVKWQRAAGMKTQVSSWSAKLKAGKW